jgi:hypothetical protein
MFQLYHDLMVEESMDDYNILTGEIMVVGRCLETLTHEGGIWVRTHVCSVELVVWSRSFCLPNPYVTWQYTHESCIGLSLFIHPITIYIFKLFFFNLTSNNCLQRKDSSVIRFYRGILNTPLYDQVCQWRGTGFIHQYNWPPRYYWNVVEKGVKHHNPNPTSVILVFKFMILYMVLQL